jgi:hypothetical protein
MEIIMNTFVSRTKKAAIGVLALATVTSGITVVSATSAEAQWRQRPAYGHGYRESRGGNRGPAVIAGIIGGIAAGALIAGATRPAYAAPAYGYTQQPVYGHGGYYQPAYSEPAYGYQPAYQPTCYFRKVRQVVDYDTVVIRRVRVCN